MLGLLVILVISWGLLHFIEKQHINVLGIIPNLNKVAQFIIGFIMMSIIVIISIYIGSILERAEWQVNTINYSTLWNAFVYHFRSALTEDLVFRGALLYILIKRIGATKGILISAVVFGVYHWFSYGILHERIIVLAYIFIATGLTGFVWAYTFYKTKSIMLALGFHLSYNLVMSCFFEAQPYGEILFSQTSKIGLIGWPEFYLTMFKGLFPPIATFICVKLLLKSKLYPQTEQE